MDFDARAAGPETVADKTSIDELRKVSRTLDRAADIIKRALKTGRTITVPEAIREAVRRSPELGVVEAMHSYVDTTREMDRQNR